LTSLGIEQTVPTLFLTECVLVYLKPDEIKTVLSFINSHFTGDIALLNYEMINPSDPFGRMMLENLEVSVMHINIKLRTVDADCKESILALQKVRRSNV
jgi:O-methyltransferase involved in polyketide biosynthesis